MLCSLCTYWIHFIFWIQNDASRYRYLGTYSSAFYFLRHWQKLENCFVLVFLQKHSSKQTKRERERERGKQTWWYNERRKNGTIFKSGPVTAKRFLHVLLIWLDYFVGHAITRCLSTEKTNLWGSITVRQTSCLFVCIWAALFMFV